MTRKKRTKRAKRSKKVEQKRAARVNPNAHANRLARIAKALEEGDPQDWREIQALSLDYVATSVGVSEERLVRFERGVEDIREDAIFLAACYRCPLWAMEGWLDVCWPARETKRKRGKKAA